MRKAAVCILLAFILPNALVVAKQSASSTGYENTAPHQIDGAILSESDKQVNIDRKVAGDTVEAAAAPMPPQETAAGGADFSEKDVELLARIVSAEARGEPYKGQVAVAAVVLNWVDEGFGESIEDVIFAEGQFQPVSNGTIHHPPLDSAYDAAEEALNGIDPTKGAVYFANMDIADNHPNPNAVQTVKIGDHTFYK